tara:strand:- start:1316 stop:2152 length:837 start_codon:yes stop_codon:yes gene_type:complete
VDEAVTQYTVEEVKQILYENEAKPEDAQILLAIAYLESKFKHGIDGDADPNDKGIWQINPPQFFRGQEPDNMVKEFFKKQGEVVSLDEFTNKVKYDIQYATQFALHIVDYRNRNPKSYGPDPFDAWTTYKKYIKPNMSKLAPTDEYVVSDGLDAEIAQAMEYVKTYNNIPFGTTTTTTTTPTTTVPATTTTTMPQDDTIDLTSRSAGIMNLFGEPPTTNYRSKTSSQVLALLQSAINSERRKKNLPDISNNLNVDTEFAQLTDDQKTILDILRSVDGS